MRCTSSIDGAPLGSAGNEISTSTRTLPAGTVARLCCWRRGPSTSGHPHSPRADAAFVLEKDAPCSCRPFDPGAARERPCLPGIRGAQMHDAGSVSVPRSCRNKGDLRSGDLGRRASGSGTGREHRRTECEPSAHPSQGCERTDSSSESPHPARSGLFWRSEIGVANGPCAVSRHASRVAYVLARSTRALTATPRLV